MISQQSRFNRESGPLRGALLLLLCTAACPADNPSSCGYIGWNNSSGESSGTSVDMTTGAVSATDELPTTTIEPGNTTSSASEGVDTNTDSAGDTSTGAPVEPSECALKPLSERLGIDGPISEEDGIFVHPVDGQDTNEGTPSKPKRTLQGAIDATTAAKHIVFLCTVSEGGSEVIPASDDPGPVEVKAGISIVGGMFCQKGEWLLPETGRRTRLSDLTGIGLRVTPGPEPALLAHLELRTKAVAMTDEEAQYADTDVERSGNSAIGVIVEGGALDLLEVTITTGPATPGKHGHSLHDVPAAVGPGGGGAEPAQCTDIPPLGNPDPVPSCDNGVARVAGGRGGAGGAVNGQGSSGLPGETVENGGNGGDGGPSNKDDSECLPLGAGEGGKPGSVKDSDGIWGSISVPFGGLSFDGYFAEAGRDGSSGANGGGGGGGRGANGPANDPLNCSFPKSYQAASGGDGGGGGCGGRGGVGGGSGGSSITVVSLNASVKVLDSQLFVGDGGAGGNAGGRQLGAAGGKGGSGLDPSCGGGNGGKGRDGRFAGAGMGGHSVAIGYIGPKPLLCGNTTNSIKLGDAGAGGDPEADAPVELQESLRGKGGEAASALEFCPPAPEPCE